MVRRITVPTRVACWEGGIGFEVGAGQIIEQHIEVDIEQVAPASDQMVEQRLLVFEQPIVTAVQLVDLRQPGILP